jgi:hypothetical protein
VAILDQLDFDSVRRAIDVTLDDGIEDDDDRILPDRVISDPVYAAAVESELAALIPASAPWPGTLAGATLETVKRAAILLTAARIYPAIPQITQEQMGEHRWRREYETVDDVVARLRSDAMGVLLPLLVILYPDRTSRVSTFRRATACRGR